MTNTYYLVRDIIKKYHNKNNKMNLKSGILYTLLISSIFLLILSFYNLNKGFGWILLAISLFCILFFYVKLYSEYKNILKTYYDSRTQIEEIKWKLASLNINSIEIIVALQDEIEIEIANKNRDNKQLYRRISILFIFIFWAPFSYLTKYFIEHSGEILEWNMYISLNCILFGIFMTIVGILIMINHGLDRPISFIYNDLKLVNVYLKDVKYSYIMDKS